jgi:hypothetical protein
LVSDIFWISVFVRGEIKTAIDKGDADAIIELIFLPLYGKANHKELAFRADLQTGAF